MYIRTGGRNWPEALQNAITVIFSFFSLDVKILTFLEPFSVMTESGFYLYATFFNVETVPRCIGKFIFGRHFLQHVKKYSNIIPFRSLSSSYRKTFSSHILAISVSLLKLFEIPISLATLNAVARTVCMGQNLLFRVSQMRNDCYDFIFIFGNNDAVYRGADKSLARPTSRCILFDGENISFYASLVIYIYIYTHTHKTLILLQLWL